MLKVFCVGMKISIYQEKRSWSRLQTFVKVWDLRYLGIGGTPVKRFLRAIDKENISQGKDCERKSMTGSKCKGHLSSL